MWNAGEEVQLACPGLCYVCVRSKVTDQPTIGDEPNGKSSLQEFTFEEDGKSIKFPYLVQSIQVALSEVGWGRSDP